MPFRKRKLTINNMNDKKKKKKGNIKLMNHTKGNDLRKYNRSRKREKTIDCIYANEK